MRGMVIEMNDEQLRSLADLQGFLDGTVTMEFTVAEDERYAFIADGEQGTDHGFRWLQAAPLAARATHRRPANTNF